MSGHRAADPLRCAHCRELIGIYEPMMLLSDGAPARTSRAALSKDEPLAGEAFHADCYAQREPEGPPA